MSIIIANWKMNLSLEESVTLVKAIDERIGKLKELELVICPSFVFLDRIGQFLSNKKSKIKLGAQDIFWEEKGAYTGEISGKMLKEMGCEYVIIGHSERRGYLNETDEMVHQKVKTALDERLIPIICVVESFRERGSGQKDYVVIKQVNYALKGIEVVGSQKIIIAYEPVWVIGSGQAVKPEEAEYTHQVIRQALLDLYSPDLIEKNFRIIYGGSVDGKNIKSFLQREMVDGVLVGGASIKVETFIALVNKSI